MVKDKSKMRVENELKEKRSRMTMNVDEMRLKNTLSHEVHVTQKKTHTMVEAVSGSPCGVVVPPQKG